MCLIYNADILQSKVVSFFQKLYGDILKPMRGLTPSSFPHIDSCDVEFLGKEVIDEEIKKVLFDMTLLKAP